MTGGSFSLRGRQLYNFRARRWVLTLLAGCQAHMDERTGKDKGTFGSLQVHEFTKHHPRDGIAVEWSSSSFTSSVLPFFEAFVIGVSPPGPFAFTFAPLLSRSLTISRLFSSLIISSNAVFPLGEVESTSAPWARSNRTRSR